MKNSRGYVLVIVLIAVLLCATLTIILFERGRVSLQSSSAFSRAAQVRALSEMAVNRVQSQIRDATTLNQTLSTPLNKRDTWASQPGAIRVYGPDGKLRSIYKLYSSDTMVTDDPDLAGDVPANWYERPAEFVDLNEPVRNGDRERYPIVDPNVASHMSGASGLVDGFSIRSDAPIEPGNPLANRAPMPVRWIYVLEDGTLCGLGDSRIDRETNPIIGRIAFWTDDETLKVNINTASPVTPNSYWDSPRAAGNDSAIDPTEFDYSWKQPSQNEYQRYPGHPATVSLLPILGDLGGLSREDYFKISPRYYWGGSEEGTKKINEARTSLLAAKSDRAYATVDELLFRSRPTGPQTGLTAQQIESLRFFLTASSRAPELNLFGQPRVSIWPIHAVDSDTRRTPFDRLIAFCSTIGGKAYYFTRENPLSATHDYEQIPRNKELYAYLRKLTDTPVPGFGQSDFASRYGADRDQILTEIFDYIRTTNLNESYQGRNPNFVSYTPDLLSYKKFTDDYAAHSHFKGAGFVVPIEIGDTKGGGRFPAITEAGLWFVQHTRTEEDPNDRNLQAMLVIKTITPTLGYMPWVGPDMRFEITNASVGARVGDNQSQLFAGGISKPIWYSPHRSDGITPGGYEGAAWTSGASDDHRVQDETPFFGVDIPVPESASTFSIEGGSVDIRLIVDGKVVQTYRFDFPRVSDLPLPAIDNRDHKKDYGNRFPWWRSRARPSPFAPWGKETDVLRSVQLPHGDARLALMAKTSPNSPFSDYVPHPDYYDATKPFAHGMRSYSNHPLLWPGGTTGSYVEGLPLRSLLYNNGQTGNRDFMIDYRPDLPPNITDLRKEGWSGDFDNGIGNFPDGPFLNKPDEGTAKWEDNEPPYWVSRWELSDGFFSPLRQVPSAVMFGSLPTGVKAGIPWRTLLFCPNPRDPNHIGFHNPPDHLLLDLFRMPVVEPYAISGPASTDGKINMNYAIAPFSYIRRASAWYSLLEPMKIFSVPDNRSHQYKGDKYAVNYRKTLNIEETLSQFEDRFSSGDIFRSATEICSLFLVPNPDQKFDPQNASLASVRNLESGYWASHRLTGDNSREKPYAELYPKITTQSNTFRIHMRVQVLPRSDGLPPNQTDFKPLAEYRGSRLIERFLNPSDPRFSSVDPDQDNLNELYQYRVLENRQFNP